MQLPSVISFWPYSGEKEVLVRDSDTLMLVSNTTFPSETPDCLIVHASSTPLCAVYTDGTCRAFGNDNVELLLLTGIVKVHKTSWRLVVDVIEGTFNNGLETVAMIDDDNKTVVVAHGELEFCESGYCDSLLAINSETQELITFDEYFNEYHRESLGFSGHFLCMLSALSPVILEDSHIIHYDASGYADTWISEALVAPAYLKSMAAVDGYEGYIALVDEEDQPVIFSTAKEVP
jgi:hypothetical protein